MHRTEVLRGVRPGNARRRPKIASTSRVCATERCTTLVSQYNLTDHCNRHRPKRYPRLRGVIGQD